MPTAAQPEEQALRVAGLGFAAGGVRVLSDMDLAVAEGEFLGIIGPNRGAAPRPPARLRQAGRGHGR